MQITITQGGNTATINVTGTKLTRLSDAWQKHFGTSVAPTVGDVADHFKQELRRVVASGEKKAVDEANQPAPYDPD